MEVRGQSVCGRGRCDGLGSRYPVSGSLFAFLIYCGPPPLLRNTCTFPLPSPPLLLSPFPTKINPPGMPAFRGRPSTQFPRMSVRKVSQNTLPSRHTLTSRRTTRIYPYRCWVMIAQHNKAPVFQSSSCQFWKNRPSRTQTDRCTQTRCSCLRGASVQGHQWSWNRWYLKTAL